MTRLRELGIVIGEMPPGPCNAITDVPGVRVGYAQVVRDSPTIVRSGVTAIWPRGETLWADPVFAGVFSFNGYGEMTGVPWIEEQGLIDAPICLTNTYSVGVVRDALTAFALKHGPKAAAGAALSLPMPVVTETWDGLLSDIVAQAVTGDHTVQALEAARSGPIAEGNVGGGTGMICHEFKGGTGTASRRLDDGATLGVLVQANYGRREDLRIDGVAVGRAIGIDVTPSPARQAAESGSIIVIVATDAPLLPLQCQRLAKRATIGLARVGGLGANTSGDLFLAFSTGNHLEPGASRHSLTMLDPQALNPYFRAAAEATEEAILNALCAAETLTGVAGRTAHKMPLNRVADLFRARGVKTP